MTHVQQSALAFIRAYIAEHDGVSPSYDEIVASLGIKSKSGVLRVITALEDRGHIRREGGPRAARAIVLPDAAPSEYERGYRQALIDYGHSAETPTRTRASCPPPRGHSGRLSE